MPNYAILRTKKHSSIGTITASLKHNFREIHTHNANMDLTHSNMHYSPFKETLIHFQTDKRVVNTTGKALTFFEKRMKQVSQHSNIRKNAVLVIEYLLTASPEWWKTSSAEQRRSWRQENLNFLIQKHGAHNIIACTYQRDETTPHISAFVIPEVNGKLNARQILGGKQKLKELQTNYAKQMAKFGLVRGIENSKAHHIPIQEFYAAVNANPTPIKLPEPKSFFQSKTEYKKEIEDNLNMEYSQKIKALNYKKQQLEEREKRLVILDNHRVEVGKKLKELENVKKQLTELEKKNEKVDFENQAYQMQLKQKRDELEKIQKRNVQIEEIEQQKVQLTYQLQKLNHKNTEQNKVIMRLEKQLKEKKRADELTQKIFAEHREAFEAKMQELEKKVARMEAERNEYAKKLEKYEPKPRSYTQNFNF